MTKTFSDLGLSSTLLLQLERSGYTTPTPIQAQAIPHLLNGHDLLGIAQTGTGKTAAFALPILQKVLSERKMPVARQTRVLVLSPTRELASQIADSFAQYSRGTGLQIATIYGGAKYGPQYKALNNGLDILVATPGRLIDHIEQKTVDLSAVEFFVLDEADQMLDLGFVKPIRQIASRIKGARQNLFFSATMPKEIGLLASELLKDPKKVEVTPEATTAERVEQSVIFIEAVRKRALLTELYAEDKLSRTLVFTRTKRSADKVAAYLQAGGIEAAAIHGDKSQGQRERALQAFKAGKVRALVATDIAARGIDVDSVSHVINYELPNVSEAYVHRIGRTARAGKTGISISFCSDDERKMLKDIERMTRQRIPSFDRRKDQALKLLDEAMLASGVAEKPTTPDRIPAKKEARHIDGDAEFVHKRQRNRPGRSERTDRREGGSSFADRKYGAKKRDFAERPANYDPMAAERPAAPAGAKKPFVKKDFSERPAFGGQKDFADRKPQGRKKPWEDRNADAPREFKPREDRPREERAERGAHSSERRTERGPKPEFRGDRPAKPADFRGKKPQARKDNASGKNAFGGDRNHYSEAPRPKSEGAQFKRRNRG
ncbi:DEAD/DEAH box helicase [Asticcacaulis sp. 201]|uniref:DEAD/DEAH box helicase n=1 Tax=Asticcacaulis sp. 201 TaxID=3028787 RepID=UPI002915CAC9|nr:DEAD/DEAH box helicase [Asticcacaulis sp. 201]MDV6331708.1 DEAD/DEAH box helicase [Asticcacaulis sp. 201]